MHPRFVTFYISNDNDNGKETALCFLWVNIFIAFFVAVRLVSLTALMAIQLTGASLDKVVGAAGVKRRVMGRLRRTQKTAWFRRSGTENLASTFQATRWHTCVRGWSRLTPDPIEAYAPSRQIQSTLSRVATWMRSPYNRLSSSGRSRKPHQRHSFLLSTRAWSSSMNLRRRDHKVCMYNE